MRPPHLVLDEPTAQLDPEGTRLVGEALRELAATGTALLIVEHKTDLLDGLCSRVLVARRRPDRPRRAGADGPRRPAARRLGRRAAEPRIRLGRRLAAARPRSRRSGAGMTDAAPRGGRLRLPGRHARARRRRPAIGPARRSPSSARTAAASRRSSATSTACCDRPRAASCTTARTSPARSPALAAPVGIVFQNPDRQIFAGKVRAEVEFGPRILGRRGTERRGGGRRGALEAVGLADAATPIRTTSATRDASC